jgi:hypothetical protein
LSIKGAKATTWDYEWITETYTDDTVCVELTMQHLAMLLTATQPMVWRTRWFNRPSDFNLIQSLVGDLQNRLLSPVDCAANCPDPLRSQRSAAQSTQLFIDLLGELDVKFRLPNGEIYNAVIDLIEDCGCDRSNGNGGNVAGIPGATSGDAGYGDFLTLCDVVTAWTPVLLDDVDDFIGTLSSVGVVAERFIGLSGSLLAGLIDEVIENAQIAVGELQDPDFVELVRQVIARTFDDPLTSDITRSQLQSLTNKIPLVFEGAPMWAVFTLWSAQVDMTKVNRQFQNVRGQGDQSICGGIFQSIGREQFNPSEVAPGGTVTQVLTLDDDVFAFELTVQRELIGETVRFDAPPNIEFVGWVFKNVYRTQSPGGFAGLQIVISGNSPDPTTPIITGSKGAPGSWLSWSDGSPEVSNAIDSLYTDYGDSLTRERQSNNLNPQNTNALASIGYRDNPIPPAGAPGNYVDTIFAIYKELP